MPRPTKALVDLAAIRHNILAVRKRVGPSTRILAAVKADAYGHGAIAVSRAAESAGADMFGVATVEEGIELRIAGIELPILILGQVLPAEMSAVVEHRIMPSVCTHEAAEALQVEAARHHRQVRATVNVDTGMGRVGVHPHTAAVDFIVTLQSLPNVIIEGVFTHFPLSDEPDRSFCYEQLARFTAIREQLRRTGIDIPVFSMANSGAIFDVPESYFDLVRPGLMVYGFPPSKHAIAHIDLRRAMTLVSKITFAKRVRAGTTIGYGRTYTVEKDHSLVVTIPIGYADGYNRRLSNCGPVLIGGKRYTVAGRVSMDQINVDLGPEGDATVGDEVVLLGRQGENDITAEELADLVGTIVHEITCGISKRVPRVWNEPEQSAVETDRS